MADCQQMMLENYYIGEFIIELLRIVDFIVELWRADLSISVVAICTFSYAALMSGEW